MRGFRVPAQSSAPAGRLAKLGPAPRDRGSENPDPPTLADQGVDKHGREERSARGGVVVAGPGGSPPNPPAAGHLPSIKAREEENCARA
jgi:hypothetical protein